MQFYKFSPRHKETTLSKAKKKPISPWYVIGQVGQIGFLIALPLAVMIFFGHWLDVQFGYRAFFIFFAMAIALAISSYALFLKISRLVASNKSLNKNKTN